MAIKILPTFKYLSLVDTTDSRFVKVTTKAEVMDNVNKLRKKLVNDIGDALELNEIKRREKVKNLVFIDSFEVEQIVTAYNFVLAVRESKINKANKVKDFVKFVIPFLLGVKQVKEKLTPEQTKLILTGIGFL